MTAPDPNADSAAEAVPQADADARADAAPQARITAALAQGAQRQQPWAWARIEALARRSESHGGEVRRRLDARLTQLLDDYDARCRALQTGSSTNASATADDSATSTSVPAAASGSKASAAPDAQAARPLRQLLAHIAEQTGVRPRLPSDDPLVAAPAPAAAPAAPVEARRTPDRQGPLKPGRTGRKPAAEVPPAPTTAPAPLIEDEPELKAKRYFRSTWSRLRADRRINQSQAQVPEKAGPLNSQHLVHQSLKLMRELAPEYLNQFMAHVDALAAAELLQAAQSAPANAGRGERTRRATRSRGKGASGA